MLFFLLQIIFKHAEQNVWKHGNCLGNANENGLQLCAKCSEILTEWFNCDTCSIILCSECKVFHEEKYANHCLRNTSAVKAEDDEFEGLQHFFLYHEIIHV
jgi:hypothetical protein